MGRGEIKGTTRTQVNLLDLIPVHKIKWERMGGLIILFKPKFAHPFLAKYVLPRMKNPYFRIKLDEIGSHFWENCNGERTVREIAEIHKRKFGEKVEPLYDRIALFLQSLEKHRFIILKGKDFSDKSSPDI